MTCTVNTLTIPRHTPGNNPQPLLDDDGRATDLPAACANSHAPSNLPGKILQSLFLCSDGRFPIANPGFSRNEANEVTAFAHSRNW